MPTALALVKPVTPSQPTRAAWIEILLPVLPAAERLSSQPTRAAWIEICTVLPVRLALASQPTRAAWIEMVNLFGTGPEIAVAAHSGCVD